MPTALEQLHDRVVARFVHDGRGDVDQPFGWNVSAEQIADLSRIAWIPGDESGGLGAIGAPKHVGGRPRQLFTVDELCTWEISGHDPAIDTERAQYAAARTLLEHLLRAVYVEAHGTFRLLSAKWVGGARGHRAGAALRVTFSVQAPIAESVAAPATVHPTTAALDVAEHDLTDSVEVSP